MVESIEEEVPKSESCWSSIVQKPAISKKREEGVGNLILEECKSSKGIAVAIIDANAVIQGGEKLKDYADKFVSVSEVMEEIKDPVSRHRLAFVPFTIDNMEPSSEALKTVVNFARATGDLQTLSDVDLKLIALTYTLEAQIHGTKHLRDSPPPIHLVNVKRMPAKELPGWGSNVPNLEEWEALEHAVEMGSNSESRILPLKDLSLNVIPAGGHAGSEDCTAENGGEDHVGDKVSSGNFRNHRRYAPVKKEINIEGKMVSDGIDASQGQVDDNASDWLPAVSRSTHRRFLRRKARRELSEASSEKNDQSVDTSNQLDDDSECPELLHEDSEMEKAVNEVNEEVAEQKIDDGGLSSILKQMRLEDNLSGVQQGRKELTMSNEGFEACDSGVSRDISGDSVEENVVEVSSQTNETIDGSYMDDETSEQSWTLRSLSESSVACVTSDFAMQNVILQIGLRLLAPGGMQIRELHRWVLKCHACNKVTAEIGRIFCPKCGNGGTLRKVAVTVGENGIVLAGRRPRVTLRGTKFSLPLPLGGREAITKNLILREDQLPHKVLYPKTKKKVNKEGDDIFVSDDIFGGHNSDKRAPLKPPIRKALAVFSGRRNPNDNHFSRAKH
ncbi:Rna-binding protein nob1 [Thalictrum thalictroides]|uniref:Rna-binding protein nob1 n=1 Tax=Thalictrum thalictroides TaxID=46969 RepID=A0A7J6VDT2_THATH|nr:Rna-binding protein nob1 [Thalictrum thalictroides]